MSTATLAAPETGRQQRASLDVGERLENAATGGNHLITIGRSSTNTTDGGVFQAKNGRQLLTRLDGFEQVRN